MMEESESHMDMIGKIESQADELISRKSGARALRLSVAPCKDEKWCILMRLPCGHPRMQKNCPKRCGLCKPEVSCKDSYSKDICPIMAEAGFCTRWGFRVWMIKNCKKSCNKCTVPCKNRFCPLLYDPCCGSDGK